MLGMRVKFSMSSGFVEVSFLGGRCKPRARSAVCARVRYPTTPPPTLPTAPSPAPAPPWPQTILVVVNSPAIPLKVRKGPGTQFDILAQASHGTKLTALKSADMIKAKVGQPDQWLQVQTPEGVAGYCAAWYVML